MALTGKTIGELSYLQFPTNETLIPVEYIGDTYHISFSSITYTEGDYSQFVSDANNGVLTPGRFYLMTDYQTCYDQPDYNYNGDEITNGNFKSGSTEPLLLLAISTTGFSSTVYSTLYPKDIITYDINWGETEVTNTPAKGRITYRIDDQGNAFDYDFREVLFKRYNTYSANGYYDGEVSIDGLGNVTGIGTYFTNNGVGNVIGIVNSNSKYGVDFYEIVSIDTDTNMIVTGHTFNPINNTLYTPSTTENGMSYKQSNVISNTGFTEYNTFTSYDECFNNTCGNRVGFTVYEGYTFLLSNNVFRSGEYVDNSFGSGFRNNTFNDDCTSNSIKYRFYNNVIDNDFDNNIITEDFYNNMIVVDFRNNYIQENFYNNNLGDDDGSDFENNIINGSFYGNFYIGYDVFRYNTINGYFNNNIILNSFEYNDVKSFSDNRLQNDFNHNNLGSDFYGNTIKQPFNDNVLGDNVYNNTFYGEFVRNTAKTNVFGNIFYHNINDNSFGSDFFNNIIGDSNNIQNYFFTNNSIGDYFTNNNITGSTQYNVIQHYFTYNTLGPNFSYNQIGSNFTNNNIASDFGYGGSTYRGNIIGNGFAYNTIGEYFYDNTVGDNFYNNTISDYFINNRISYGMSNTTIVDLDNNFNCQNNDFNTGYFSYNLTITGGTGGNPILYSETNTNIVKDNVGGLYVTFLSGGTIVAETITTP